MPQGMKAAQIRPPLPLSSLLDLSSCLDSAFIAQEFSEFYRRSGSVLCVFAHQRREHIAARIPAAQPSQFLQQHFEDIVRADTHDLLVPLFPPRHFRRLHGNDASPIIFPAEMQSIGQAQSSIDSDADQIAPVARCLRADRPQLIPGKSLPALSVQFHRLNLLERIEDDAGLIL